MLTFCSSFCSSSVVVVVVVLSNTNRSTLSRFSFSLEFRRGSVGTSRAG